MLKLFCKNIFRCLLAMILATTAVASSRADIIIDTFEPDTSIIGGARPLETYDRTFNLGFNSPLGTNVTRRIENSFDSTTAPIPTNFGTNVSYFPDVFGGNFGLFPDPSGSAVFVSGVPERPAEVYFLRMGYEFETPVNFNMASITGLTFNLGFLEEENMLFYVQVQDAIGNSDTILGVSDGFSYQNGFPQGLPRDYTINFNSLNPNSSYPVDLSNVSKISIDIPSYTVVTIDNVRLNVTAVPAPPALALALFAIPAFAIFRKQLGKKKSTV